MSVSVFLYACYEVEGKREKDAGGIKRERERKEAGEVTSDQERERGIIIFVSIVTLFKRNKRDSLLRR